MKAKYDWQPIEEMDLDDGTHTGYATKVGDHFIWLTQLSDNSWDVECARNDNPTEPFFTLKNCKTLTSAKRWVSRYL